MKCFKIDNLKIFLNKKGADQYTKVTFPIRYGIYNEISTPDYDYHFNLNGEIKFIKGKNNKWPDPNEWLKRSVTNDWIYYSAGGYGGIFSFLGEYYFPCFSYTSNSILRHNPFEKKEIKDAIDSINALHENIKNLITEKRPENINHFLSLVLKNNHTELEKKCTCFHHITGGRINVLPPETRHVDYEIIPIMIADGCLYNCGFCSVKTGKKFKILSKNNIIQQLNDLKKFHGRDLINYNSIFLSQHDALHAGYDMIEFVALNALKILNLEQSYISGQNLFLFGSVTSLLNADINFFSLLNQLPFKTYINIGLESNDQETLKILGKPIKKNDVERSFIKLIELNKKFVNIEISANFVYGSKFPEEHNQAIMKLISNSMDHHYNKGDIYFSLYKDGGDKGKMQRDFYKIKNSSHLPVFTYLIQRL